LIFFLLILLNVSPEPRYLTATMMSYVEYLGSGYVQARLHAAGCRRKL